MKLGQELPSQESGAGDSEHSVLEQMMGEYGGQARDTTMGVT